VAGRVAGPGFLFAFGGVTGLNVPSVHFSICPFVHFPICPFFLNTHAEILIFIALASDADISRDATGQMIMQAFIMQPSGSSRAVR
jgi:hypothetical protein